MSDHRIRISLIPKSKQRYSLKWLKRTDRFTQGKPFELFLKITNIGNNPTPEIVASNFKLSSKTDDVSITSHNSLVLRPLNPEESTRRPPDLSSA